MDLGRQRAHTSIRALPTEGLVVAERRGGDEVASRGSEASPTKFFFTLDTSWHLRLIAQNRNFMKKEDGLKRPKK